MKPLAAGALRSLFLILLAIAAGFAASQPTGATHTHSPPRWWVDLKPWGDGRISYLLCGIPYELPPEWEQGVENWDAAMAGFRAFDLEPGGCWDTADVFLAWELGDECPVFLPGDPEPIACTWPITWEDHGTWWEMKRAHIYFNHDWYYNLGLWQEAWQVAVSAHEWGHVLNLKDYWWADQCTLNLLMGYADISQPPCLTGPSSPEVDTVVMNYGLLDSDGDSLGLGPEPGGLFPDAVEWFMGTDPFDECADSSTANDERGPDYGEPLSPWPPDFNDNGRTDIGDLVALKNHWVPLGNPYGARYDLNASGNCDIGDLVILKLYWVGSGRDTCTVG